MTVNSNPTFMDRILAAIREIIRAELPQLTYAGIWEYQVTEVDLSQTVSVSGVPTIIPRVSGIPTSSIPLPALVKVSPRPTIPGSVINPQIGSTMLIGFINSDPTRPYILAFDYAIPPGFALNGYQVVMNGALIQMGAPGGTMQLGGTNAVMEVGKDATSIQLSQNSDSLAPGAEIGRVVRYGDAVTIAPVTGVITQNPTSAPNPISRVRA